MSMDGRLPPHGSAPQLALARALRPASCKVLIGLMLAGSALDMTGLQEWTGMERHALMRGVRDLELMGLVRSYKLERGRQVFAARGDVLPALREIQMVQNLPSEPYLLTTAIEASGADQWQQQAFKGQMVQNVPSESPGEQADPGPGFAANLAACERFGIAEPVASELSAREWVNPRYIEAHVLSLQDWETRGLAVVRMRAAEAPPDWVKRGGERHRLRQERLRGTPSTYSGGAFAEYVQRKKRGRPSGSRQTAGRGMAQPDRQPDPLQLDTHTGDDTCQE